MEKVRMMIAVAMMGAMMAACGDEGLGKFVYFDADHILHSQPKCSAVLKYNNAQPVTPVKVEDVHQRQLEKICSQCVTEKQLEQLKDKAK